MAMKKATGMRVLLAGACIAGSIGLTGAASAQRWGNDWSQSRTISRSHDATFILNGERICIDGRSITYGIAEALRCKGYCASVHDGCITVHYRGHAPRVSLTGCDYDIVVTRGRGCLTIRPYLIHRHTDVHFDHGWRGGHDRWDRRPSYRRHSYPRSGFTIRIGGHCR